MATNDQVSYQMARAIPTADGSTVNYNLDRFGNLGTNNWKSDLVKLGYVWRFTTGGTLASAGADLGGDTGGGNGTTIDSDQPDFLVSNTSSDYVMIPFEGRIDSVVVDLDADGEIAGAIWAADLTQAYTTATATAITGKNLLGVVGNLGPRSLPSNFYAAKVVTSDVTDPVLSDILAQHRVQQSDSGTAASAANNSVNAHFSFDYPYIMEGPSTILGYWGGTAAVKAVASLTVAVVPTAYFSQ